MFEKFRTALSFGGGGEAMATPKSSLSLGAGEIPSGSFAGGIETAQIQGIFRDTSDAITDAAPLTNARAVRALFESDLGGAVDVALGQIVGTGLRPNVQPVAELIGWSQKEADGWARKVERLFALWAANPMEVDVAGLQNFGQMQKTAGRAYFGTGEILATFPSEKRRGTMFRSKVSLLDAHRLAESGIDNTERFGLKFQGGRPIGLRIEDRDPASGYTDYQAKTIPFFSHSQKPLSALIYDHAAPAQWRGISPLTAALKPHFQFGKLADATLAGALLQNMITATVTSNATSEEVMQMFSHGDSDETAIDAYTSAKLGWYKGNSLKGLPNVTHLLPGELLEFKQAQADADNLADFSRLLKLESARALGIGYSAATGDYSGSTYSSVRMETAVNWPLVLQRRSNVIGRFCQLAFEAWLETAILDDIISIPGGYMTFLARRAAFTRVEWRGPSMPQADENKSANAASKRLQTGTTSLSYECEALGLDWQDVLTQRAREKEMARQLHLPDPHVDDPETLMEPPSGKQIFDSTDDEMLSFSGAVDLVERLTAEKPEIPKHQDHKYENRRTEGRNTAAKINSGRKARVQELETQIAKHQLGYE